MAGGWDGVMPEGGALAELKYDGFRCGYFPGLDRKPGLWTLDGQWLADAGSVAHPFSPVDRL